jgi:hypothetical protein
MNERIQELYTQVCMEQNLPFTLEHNSAYMLDAFTDKFAELLIKECADVLLEWKKEPFPLEPDFAANLIKEHFGVER